MTYSYCAAITHSKISLNQDHHIDNNYRTGKIKGVVTIVINDSDPESNVDDDSVTSEYIIHRLRVKNDDDMSNEESGDNEYNEESENDRHNLPIVEDVIAGDKEDYSLEPKGRRHWVRTKFKQAYVPTTDNKSYPKGVNMTQTSSEGSKECAKTPDSYPKGINCAQVESTGMLYPGKKNPTKMVHNRAGY